MLSRALLDHQGGGGRPQGVIGSWTSSRMVGLPRREGKLSAHRPWTGTAGLVSAKALTKPDWHVVVGGRSYSAASPRSSSNSPLGRYGVFRFGRGFASSQNIRQGLNPNRARLWARGLKPRARNLKLGFRGHGHDLGATGPRGTTPQGESARLSLDGAVVPCCSKNGRVFFPFRIFPASCPRQFIPRSPPQRPSGIFFLKGRNGRHKTFRRGRNILVCDNPPSGGSLYLPAKIEHSCLCCRRMSFAHGTKRICRHG